jgi:hypothetical protein
MRSLLTFMLLAFSAVVFAQPELGGSKSIKMPTPSANNPSVTNPAPVPSKPMFSSIPEPKPSRTLDLTPSNSNFGKAPTAFENPHVDVEKKLNKQSYSVYDVDVKRDQFLGEIRTKSKIGRILYRDYDRIDGDVIRIYINGVQTQPQTILDEEFTGFDITFQEGTNMIEFESLSEGYAPPNTAELVVLDENGVVLFQNGWAIANGFKASVNIIRD